MPQAAERLKTLQAAAPDLSYVPPTIPRRRCDNCGKLYRPTQRLKKNDKHGFCKRECKIEFHRHGGSYAKLKPHIEAEIRKRIKLLSPADAARMDAIEMRIEQIEDYLRRIHEAALQKLGALAPKRP